MEPVYIVSESNNWVILTLLVIMFAALFVAGIRVNKNALAEYKNILKYKGRLITDFTHLVGYGVTFINMSLLGFLTLIFIWLIGGIVNGPVLAGIFTVVGFGAFGKHPKNILPVVLGVITAIVFFGKDISSTGMIIFYTIFNNPCTGRRKLWSGHRFLLQVCFTWCLLPMSV